MKNFGEIVKETLRYGFDDGPQVNKSRIEEWVNEGQQVIADQIETPEFQETEVLTMVPQKFKYNLPSEFGVMQDVYYPEMGQRIRPVDLQDFDLYGNLEGPPDRYTLYKEEIWFFPTPNTTEKLELRYIKAAKRMTLEADIPKLAEPYLHLLVDYALIRAYLAEDDAEMYNIHSQKYEKDLAKYIIANTDRIVDRPRQLDGTWSGGLY